MELFAKPKQEARGSNKNSEQWLDYMLSAFTVDVFGCDESPVVSSVQAMGDALQPAEASPTVRDNKVSLNYALKHDEFLDSLLYEQSVARTTNNSGRVVRSFESNSGLNSSITSTNSFDSDPLQNCSSSEASSKRGKRKRQRRRNSPSRDFAENGVSQQNHFNFERSQTVNMDALVQTQHEPSYYLHPMCRMQKDKGKGEEVGSIVCANGADQCLFKLQAKMRILTDYVSPLPGESKKGNATMKRRNARISFQYDSFTETRSLIELRLGFLSMTYGVLLRWDTKKSEKATLVVLRKNCHDSFYPKEKVSPLTKQAIAPPSKEVIAPPSKQAIAPPSKPIQTFSRLNPTIATKSLATKGQIASSDLKPPYLIPQPKRCDPMVLSLLIRYISGLSRKSKWLVQVCCQDTVENVLLSYDQVSSCFVPKALNSFKRELPETAKSHNVEIKLFEQFRRKRDPSRLLETLQVPVSNLEIQSTTSPKPSRRRLQCVSNPLVTIQVEMLIISDYFNWKQRELAERKKKEMRVVSRDQSHNVQTPTSLQRSPTSNFEFIQTDDDRPSHWDWVCCLC